MRSCITKGAYRNSCYRSESCCGGDPELRIARGGHGFEGSTPTEVGLKVFGCDAMEASHPFLEASVVGVDVVDVEFRLFGLWGAGRGQDVDFELGAFGESGDCRAAVAAEVGRRRNSLAERLLQAGGVEAGEDGVEGGAAAVASPPRPEFARPKSALGGLAAAATGGPGQTAPATLEGTRG